MGFSHFYLATCSISMILALCCHTERYSRGVITFPIPVFPNVAEVLLPVLLPDVDDDGEP